MFSLFGGDHMLRACRRDAHRKLLLYYDSYQKRYPGGHKTGDCGESVCQQGNDGLQMEDGPVCGARHGKQYRFCGI